MRKTTAAGSPRNHRAPRDKQTIGTNASTGRVDRNWTKSGGKAPQPGFLLVGELAQVPHYPETRASRRRGHLRVAISTVPDPSGSGRVDMLTSPVAARRAAVATGAWVKSKHMYLIHGKCGSLSDIFTHPPEDLKKKKKKKIGTRERYCSTPKATHGLSTTEDKGSAIKKVGSASFGLSHGVPTPLLLVRAALGAHAMNPSHIPQIVDAYCMI